MSERGVELVKKTVAVLLAALLLTALASPASALSVPETLNAPTGVAAENLLTEEYQYRTLIYFTLADDIIEVLSTAPSRYDALTMEGKLYVQFSIDGGSWVSFYFTGADDEGAEVQRQDTPEGRAVADGRFVTACGMGAATEFALALVKILKGEDAADKLRTAVLAK